MVNWLLLFIPVALVLDRTGASPPLVFFAAALSIVPIASWIVRSTEHLATYTGDAVGGLLNGTFGNAPELIIGVVALRAGLFDMVLASLVGAILANLLLALGVAFFLGGLKFRDQSFRPEATRVYLSMMLLAVTSMAVPSAMHTLSGGAAVPAEGQPEPGGGPGAPRHLRAVRALHAEDAQAPLRGRGRARKDTAKGDRAGAWRAHSARWPSPRSWRPSRARSWSARPRAPGRRSASPGVFVGLVFLAIVGGAAESGSAIAMGRANRMDLAVSIAVGSCIQIALFVAPLLVLLSYVFAPAAAPAPLSEAARRDHLHLRDRRHGGDRGREVELVQGRAARRGVRADRAARLLRPGLTINRRRGSSPCRG